MPNLNRCIAFNPYGIQFWSCFFLTRQHTRSCHITASTGHSVPTWAKKSHYIQCIFLNSSRIGLYYQFDKISNYLTITALYMEQLVLETLCQSITVVFIEKLKYVDSKVKGCMKIQHIDTNPWMLSNLSLNLLKCHVF